MDDGAGPDDGSRHRLDLRGLRCPLPVLHTRRALRRLAPGHLLDVLCTDPLAGIDIPHLVAEVGDALVGAERDRNGWHFTIRRRPDLPAGSNRGEIALIHRHNSEAE